MAVTSVSALAEPISRGNMPAYCRGEVAGKYGTRPQYVKTGKIVTAKDGRMSIRGTVDRGSDGIKTFKCHFDKSRNFVDVEMTTGGN
jgi:hypothetical protein